VKSYASELGVEAEDSVYEYIAENFVNNVRELKGAFNKVCAYAEFLNVGLTLDTAKKALNCEMKKRLLTPEMIAKCVADYFGVTVKDLKSPSRQQKISKARQMAVFLSRDILGLSYEAIGDFYVKKHTTVMYGFEQVNDKLKTDDNLQNVVDEIKALLKEL
jgi:chromosomal replication initiator protein